MSGGRIPRVLVVVGTRPEAIKMAPVHAALRRRSPRFEVELALTGQHTELVDEALETFELVPDHDLEIMREGQSLYDVAAGCLEGLHRLVDERRPDLILVQGDTASVFFGALVGFFEGVRLGHVEAGLRSGDLSRPFPEEGFRRLTAVLADLHFAPTALARRNLLEEGVEEARIHVTGNTVVDALLDIAGRSEEVRDRRLLGLLQRAQSGGGPFALLTTHRREAFGAPMERIFRAVLTLLGARPELEVLYPVHPNPQVRSLAERTLGPHPRVHRVGPLRYPDLVRALAGSALVLTDSGGIQEEAPTFGTPVLVLREVTERPEGVEAGIARVVGQDEAAIVSAALEVLDEGPAGRERRRGANPYGDGTAGERIAAVVERYLGVGP